jgi:hypothetical protein
MRFKSLTRVYDFLQVLHIKRSHSTKNYYLPMYIIFTIIYLLQKQKLNPTKYYEQEINMRNIVRHTEHDGQMYAKFGGLTSYELL